MQYALKLELDKQITKHLKGSGFEKLFGYFPKHGKVQSVTHYRPLMDALCQCFDKDNNTFDLGQTKIYFGLEDVFMITGLPIDGEPVRIGEVTKEECLELVGIPPGHNNRLRHASLVEIITKINDESSQLEVEQACRATALLGIDCTVIQAIGKSSIHMKYLSILKDVDKIKSYAWGAASWANLINSLKNSNPSNIVGCTMALMIFAFLRMPQLVSLCYLKHKVKGKNPNSSSVKALTMTFHEACIIWRPYVEVGKRYESQKHIAKSITYVFADHIAILHRPDLVPGQLFGGELNQDIIQNWVNSVIESDNRLSVWETRRDRLVSEVIPVADEGIGIPETFPAHTRESHNSSTSPSDEEIQNSSTFPSNEMRLESVFQEDNFVHDCFGETSEARVEIEHRNPSTQHNSVSSEATTVEHLLHTHHLLATAWSMQAKVWTNLSFLQLI
ncbi:hypothetical protein TSUD_49680 [Trifolium subterraneum]|uniref:Aminotransferase-like plant mobile domain-containing protein n=1 Tax=Trifolium subterraneum TaxID=3900 RepID=A0A2Z6M1G5_TRISU|nr:hypothetical protein TSUD_49680 [Trifolium subterraneum]